jgi:hypothetical protein
VEAKEQLARETVIPATMVEILEKLIRYAEESDSEAVEYLDSVREEAAAACPSGDFEKLEASLRLYDFSTALQILRLLSRRLEGSV